MVDISLQSADAFILVYAVDDPSSWDEVVRLRSLVTSLRQSRDADTETADTGPELERMTSKNSRRSRRRVDSRYCGFRYI